MAADLKKEVAAYQEELVRLRRHFHEHPELGYMEYDTARYIEEYMNEIHVPVTHLRKTGLSALITGGKPGKTVLLRADMDALPIKEQTGLPYASKYPGIMHACGHDGHIAIQLCVAKYLAAHKEELSGNVKLLFQPNEEEAGALDMIHDGVLEQPHVDAAFALHLWSPIKSGRIALSAGPVLGTTEEFELVITGKTGHTAMPHEAKDALFGACQIVNAMQELISREFNPLWPIAVVFGKLAAGSARNIICGEASLGGTIRFLFPDEKEMKPKVLGAFERIVKGVCDTYELGYQLEFIPSNPSLINDAHLIELVRENAKAVYDKDDCIDDFKSLAGEDFAEISQRVPSVMSFVGINNPATNSTYPQHHEKFTIDEQELLGGMELQIRNVYQYLSSE